MNTREPEYLRERGEAFWKRVDKHGPRQLHMGSRCWVWTGATFTPSRVTYGKFRYDGEAQNAHRFAWLTTFGDPGDQHVLHHCDYGLCVRPMHLFLGTGKDNVRDKVAKGRQARGSQMPHSKLTEGVVLELKAMWERYVEKHGWERQNGRHVVGKARRYGRMRFYERAARRFGVTVLTVSRAINGQAWAHVADAVDLEIKAALAKLTERERLLLGL